ncbi:MAG TPA: VOC family protein [Candidatus Kapabacteria bacterium]|nr:VOC family protein [Candidatus Kapabacteria bacterium]
MSTNGHLKGYILLLVTTIKRTPKSHLKNEAIYRRRPGALHHLAFRATSEQEVDDLSEKLVLIGTTIVEGPSFFPQHGQYYYAIYFKDSKGIKYEIVFEERA